MAQTDEQSTKSSQLVISMKLFKQCKHSVRYKALDEANPILDSIYLYRDAYDDLGQPERIRVEIKKV